MDTPTAGQTTLGTRGLPCARDRPPPLGWTSAPAWPTTSVLFQGQPGLPGHPGKVGVQGPKVGEKPELERS